MSCRNRWNLKIICTTWFFTHLCSLEYRSSRAEEREGKREKKILSKRNLQGCCFTMSFISLFIHLFVHPNSACNHVIQVRVTTKHLPYTCPNLKATDYLTDQLPCFCEVKGNQRAQRKATGRAWENLHRQQIQLWSSELQQNRYFSSSTSSSTHDILPGKKNYI